MIKRTIVIQNGNVVTSDTEDTATVEEVTLRDAIPQSLTDLQTIQGAALSTEAAQITAIKQEAQILEKVIKFISRRI